MKKKNKEKVEKRKTVMGYPQVSFMAQIKIMEKEKSVSVGGFTADGGFYLREGFNLIKEKIENIQGEKVTYFNFVKDPKKKGMMEKEYLKQRRKEERWKKQREKELEKELKSLKKKK